MAPGGWGLWSVAMHTVVPEPARHRPPLPSSMTMAAIEEYPLQQQPFVSGNEPMGLEAATRPQPAKRSSPLRSINFAPPDQIVNKCRRGCVCAGRSELASIGRRGIHGYFACVRRCLNEDRTVAQPESVAIKSNPRQRGLTSNSRGGGRDPLLRTQCRGKATDRGSRLE